MKRPSSGKSATRVAARPSKRWIIRGLSAAAIGIVGAFFATHSMAFLLRSSKAATAHALAPYDGRITALAAAFIANAGATPRDRFNADALAKLALRQDATAVVAVSTIGLNAQVRGQVTAARNAFGYAETLSRRDAQTQLWAIEDAVQRDDIDGVLRHYDTTLRVTPSLSEMLFPVLSAASNDPQIRVALIRTLRSKPAWMEGFINYAATNSTDPRSTAQMLTAIARAGGNVPEAAQASLISKLAATGFSIDAWNYYAANQRGADRRISRDPRFATHTENPTVFDWTVVQAAGISSSIQREGSHGIFDFSAPAMIGGKLLQQTQLLPIGEYRLEGHSIGIDQSENARPYWLLSCQDGHEIGRIVVPNSNNANGRFEGMFTVPQGCPIQTLILVAQPSEAIGGLSGQFDYVQLAPASNARR